MKVGSKHQEMDGQLRLYLRPIVLVAEAKLSRTASEPANDKNVSSSVGRTTACHLQRKESFRIMDFGFMAHHTFVTSYLNHESHNFQIGYFFL